MEETPNRSFDYGVGWVGLAGGQRTPMWEVSADPYLPHFEIELELDGVGNSIFDG